MSNSRCPACGNASEGGVCPSCRAQVTEQGAWAFDETRVAPDSTLPLQAAARVPDRIGTYVVDRLLGKGAMGHVYLAHDPKLERTVAIKILSPGLFVEEQSFERFQREAKVLARINSPNVVTVHDLGIDLDEGTPYLVMEYVDGQSLDSMVRSRGGTLSVEESVRVIRDALRAVAAIHKVGIVHRDVKPANFLVTAEGAVKLADFGIAHVAGGGTRLTQTGAMIGTPSYMSPEQWEAAEVDARSDIYSLGVTWYHLLSGDLPYSATTPMLLIGQVTRDERVPFTQRRPDVPPAFASIIERMSARHPDDRYSTCDEVLAAIDAAEDDPAAAPAARPRGRPSTRVALRRPSRGPLWIGLGAVALVVAAALGLALAGGRRDPEPIEPGPVVSRFRPSASIVEPVLGPILADRELELVGTLESDRPVHRPRINGREVEELAEGRWRAIVTLTEGDAVPIRIRVEGEDGSSHEQVLWQGIVDWSEPEVEILVRPEGPLAPGATARFEGIVRDPSGVERLLFDGQTLEFEIGAREVRWRIDWTVPDEDRRQVAVEAVDRAGHRRWHGVPIEIAIADPADRIYERNGSRYTLADLKKQGLFGRGGKAYNRFDMVRADLFGHAGRAYSAAEVGQEEWFGRQLSVVDAGPERLDGALLTPDGHWLLAGSHDERVRIWDVGTGDGREWQGHRDKIRAAALSRDGRVLATGGDGQVIRIWHVPEGRREKSLPAPDKVYALAFSKDARLLASAGRGAMITIWDVEAARPLPGLTGTDVRSTIRCLAVSPDGRFLASGSQGPIENCVKLWDIETGEQVRSIGFPLLHPGGTVGVAFSPDGRLLASCGNDHKVIISEVASTKRLHVLDGHDGDVTGVAFTPDGRMVASASEDETVRLWEVSSGRQVARLETKGQARSVSFTAGGQLLATATEDGKIHLWTFEDVFGAR